MTSNPRADFFDGLAERWDGWEDLATLEQRLAAGLDEFGVRADETILDVGCGTGNLTRALLVKLSPAGRVFAVDISPKMIEIARRKVPDARVSWHSEDARRLTLGEGSCDRVICYSVWPHFEDHPSVAAELRRVLKPSGSLHVWHLIPRQRVNEIHAGAGEAVCRDTLPPAEETAEVLAAAGFRIALTSESAGGYLVTAVKPEPEG